MIVSRLFLRLFAAWLAVLVAWPALAAPGTPPPIEEYVRPSAYASPIISPDGKHMAVSVGRGDRLNLAVIDLAGRKATPLTNFPDLDVIEYHWVGNDRLVFSLGQRNTPTGVDRLDGGGLFMISRDGKETRVLSPTLREAVAGGAAVYRGLSYLRRAPGSQEEILAAARERSIYSVDVYRVNVVTGRKELLTPDTPGRVQRWVLDRKGTPRLAISIDKERPVYTVFQRAADGSRWEALWSYDITTGPVVVPMGFDVDDKTLLVASNEGANTMGIYRYDLATRQRGELLARHPRFDMGADQSGEGVPGLVIDPKKESVVGFRVRAEKPQTVWTDPDYERLQRTIDQAFPGRVNNFARTPDGAKLLISSYSDRQPIRWYLMDEQKLQIEELMSSRPWLGPDKLVEVKPGFFKTRDGLEILAYVLLPAGHKPGEKLPTVVHIHGGPWARADDWGFGSFGIREGQILASRGYAVVVPNFRSTPGLGSKVFYGGKRQFGKAMQEDIEDATDWAVAQGFADPARICLSGASYGGYASLMGVAKTPDKYRCAVAGLAVTDLEMIMTSAAGDIPRNEIGLNLWKAMAGDPDKDRDALRAVSPAYLADRIKAAVMMYSGIDDIRVPLEQPQKMRRALQAQGREVVWMAKEREAHGFGTVANNIDLYTQMLKFLDTHIGQGAR